MRVEVWRGDLLESWHTVSLVLTDGQGDTREVAGDPDLQVVTRSAVKPWQALPLVEDGVADRFGLTASEIALCCASHVGSAEHVAGVQSILGKIGVDEAALVCGPQPPSDREAARALAAAGEAPRPIHNNCSGKHAGMLALAVFHAWPTEGYERPDHPVQRRMLDQVSRWTGRSPEEIGTAVDGCGVVTFSVPLVDLARGMARFAAAAVSGPVARLVRAMVKHPENVAGRRRLDTELMRATGGRVFAKSGAEGVLCAGIPDLGLGLAFKVHDGAGRAVAPALLDVLRRHDLLSAGEAAALASFAEPVVENTRGAPVGWIRAVAGSDPGGVPFRG